MPRNALATALTLIGFMSRVPCPAQPAASAPASAPVASQPARPATPWQVLTEDKSFAARTRACAELLDAGRPDLTDAVASLLTKGTDPIARLAVCEAITAHPAPPPPLLDSLLLLLDDPDARIQEAAAAALGAYRDHNVVDALAAIAGDTQSPMARRIAAVRALPSAYDAPGVIDALLRLLDSPERRVRSEAAASLRRVAFRDFEADANAWRRWWRSESSNLLSDLHARLRRTERERDALESQYLAVLEETIAKASPEIREARLAECLASALPLNRRAGIRLIGRGLLEGKTPSPPIEAAVRSLISDPDPRVRREVILLLRDLREPADAALLLARVPLERDRSVRPMLYNALGRIGSKEAIPVCTAALDDADDAVVSEAMTALGFLVEQHRAGLTPETLREVALALRNRFAQLRADPSMRAAAIEAMARMRDPVFAPLFEAEAADAQSPPPIRLAAVRGLEHVGGPAQIDVVIARLSDPDVGVREAAAKTLGAIGATPAPLQALITRLDPSVETAPTVQARNWEAIRRIFDRLGEQDAIAILTAFPTNGGAVAAERFVQLATSAEAKLARADLFPPEASPVLLRTAEELARLNRSAEAASYFEKSLRSQSNMPLETRRAILLKAVDASVAAGRFERVPPLITEYAALVQPDPGAVVSLLTERVRSLVASGESEVAITALDAIPAEVVALGAEWPARRAALYAEAIARRTAQDRENVRKWVADLQAGGDAAAQASAMIKRLGPRAVAPLREEVERLVRENAAATAQERLLIGLLRELVPAWNGYNADAPPQDRLRALAALPAPPEAPSAPNVR